MSEEKSLPPGKPKGVAASELFRGLYENTALTTEVGGRFLSGLREERVERAQQQLERALHEEAIAAAETQERVTSATIEVPQRLEALERAAEVEAGRTQERHRQVVRLMRWTLFASAMAVSVGIGALLLAWLSGGSP